MKVNLRGKLLAVEEKVSGKTGQAYNLALIMQGVETCTQMVSRDIKVNIKDFVNKEVLVEVEYSTRYKNLGAITSLKAV